MMRISTLIILGLLPFALLTLGGDRGRRGLRSLSETFPIFGVSRNFDVQSIPDMTGKVVIITGGNAGLGFESALQLTKKGATVVIGCRDDSKGRAAVLALEEHGGKAEQLSLDLASFASIRKFVQLFRAKHDQLHVLLLNAGKDFPELTATEGGFEANIGVHHLGHAYLTFLLLPVIITTKPCRIVVVSSSAQGECTAIDYDHLLVSSPGMKYDPLTYYSQSKLANALFARNLALEFQKKGMKDVFVNAVNPGFVITDFGWLQRTLLAPKIAHSTTDGALTQLYAATSPDIVSKHITGEYFYPIAMRGLWGANTSPAAVDWDKIEEFWKWTIATLQRLDSQLDLSFFQYVPSSI